MSFWDRLFAFLEKYVPWLLAGYYVGSQGEKKEKLLVEKKLEGVELELEKQKNKAIIEEINKNLDNRSIIKRAIDKGRDLLKKNKTYLL